VLNGSGMATLSTAALPAGTDAVTASYAGMGNSGASTSTASPITVNAASQTITFAAIASRPYGSGPFAVTASSSLGSSYPVTIIVQSGPATISGGLVTITGAGTVVLQATQAGDTKYGPATTTQSFQATPAALTVAANNATRSAGAANPAFSGTVTGAVGSDSFSESFTTTATASSDAGSYPIVPSVTGPQLANYTVTVVDGTLTVTAAAPVGTPGSYTVAANPTSLTVVEGATAKTTLTLTPAGGYSGTIALSCSNLPSNASCTFAQNQVALTGNNQSLSVGLTIQTTAQQAGNQAPSQSPFTPALFALAFWWPGGLTGLAVFARKRRLMKTQRLGQLCLLLVCTMAFAVGLSGCGVSGNVSHFAAPTTSQITVVATGTSGTAVTTQTVTLTLSMSH
jgi:hypothetical protein